eukprot:scaffold186420_cov17-Tisochrysis_lutea.AAC.1
MLARVIAPIHSYQIPLAGLWGASGGGGKEGGASRLPECAHFHLGAPPDYTERDLFSTSSNMLTCKESQGILPINCFCHGRL